MRRNKSVKQGRTETLAWEGSTGVEVREAADSFHFPHVEMKKKKKRGINVCQSGCGVLREEREASGLELLLLIAAQQGDGIRPIRFTLLYHK